MSSQVACWDFTIPQNEEFETAEDIKTKILDGWCKHWVYQLERGDTGYMHWQGRVSLIKKRRQAELLSQGWCKGGRISPTSNGGSKTFNYVMKVDTRVSGPFRDTDAERPPMTRQLREFWGCSLRPWQRQVEDICKTTDNRTIHLVYDQVGNIGKSIFAEYLEYQGLATEIPPFRSMEDIMQCAMGMPVASTYLIDMPRGMKKDKLGEFYSGLESLKNGVMYDKRYAFKKRRIDRPNILVFSNCLPDFELLSRDRWVVWDVTPDYHLERNEVFSGGPAGL